MFSEINRRKKRLLLYYSKQHINCWRWLYCILFVFVYVYLYVCLWVCVQFVWIKNCEYLLLILGYWCGWWSTQIAFYQEKKKHQKKKTINISLTIIKISIRHWNMLYIVCDVLMIVLYVSSFLCVYKLYSLLLLLS